jgi:hypothetical protein
MSIDKMLRVGLLLLALAVQEEAKPLPELHSFLAEFRRSLHTDDLLLSDYTYLKSEHRSNWTPTAALRKLK